MNDKQYSMYMAHLRAIRSAIVALSFAVLAATFFIIEETLDFYLLILTLVACIYSFVPPLLHLWRNA